MADQDYEHQSHRFAIGAQFDSFMDLKRACIRAALLDVYEFDTVKVPPPSRRQVDGKQVDSDRYRIRCKNGECAWFLYAMSLDETDVWEVRTTTQAHVCHGINHDGHCNIDEDFVAHEILPKVRMDNAFTPKSIQNHFKDQYGVKISYSKAYRAKERALNIINGSHEEAYGALPKYCDEILRSNPGSTVKLEIDAGTNQFKRLFVCFATSAMGFAYCRPLLGLDGTHLKHKYQGTSMS